MQPKSVSGTARWLARFNEAVQYVAHHADDCPMAEEADEFNQSLQQHILRTRRGNPYRLVFIAESSETMIMTIRGAGQDWLKPGDLDFDD